MLPPLRLLNKTLFCGQRKLSEIIHSLNHAPSHISSTISTWGHSLFPWKYYVLSGFFSFMCLSHLAVCPIWLSTTHRFMSYFSYHVSRVFLWPGKLIYFICIPLGYCKLFYIYVAMPFLIHHEHLWYFKGSINVFK